MLKKCVFILVFNIVTLALYAQPDIINLAQRFYNNGQYEQALTIYQKLNKENVHQDAFYAYYFNTLLKTQNYTEAEKLVKKNIKTNPFPVTYMIDWGYLYEQKNELTKANKIYDKAINNLPPYQNPISQSATIFYNRQNYNYALKTLIQGRKILNDKTIFSSQIIDILIATQNKDAVIQEVVSLLYSSPNYLNDAKNSLAQVLSSSSDFAMLKTVLIKQLQKQPDNTTFAELLTWQYLQQKDFKSALAQTIALDKRGQQNGDAVFAIAEICSQNKEYETASKAYQYLVLKGEKNPYYVTALVQNLNNKKQLLIENKLLMPDLLSLETDYNTLLGNYGKNYQTLFAITNLAHLQAYYLNKPTQAQKLLLNALQINNITQQQVAEIKLQLGDIYFLNNTIWEAALLYSQVEKTFANQPLGHEAKLRNAKLSFYNADFKWAQSQLDVLKASTSQLIANDALDLSLLIQDNLLADSTGKALKMYALAELNVLKNNFTQALLTLDSIATRYPNSPLGDDILLSKAKIFTKQNNPTAAAAQYQAIINHHSQGMYIDDALFLLAQLQEQKLNLPKQALQNYQTLLNNYPGSPYVTEAREKFRTLRGDAL
jgi:tetratricopeptide (TPR) repeat protein